MQSNYKNLFIIGNGFDRWQGLPTSYDDFRWYYFAHVSEIAKGLGIKTTLDHDGHVITPVEMIFGDIFRPGPLPEEFFWNFESAMGLLDGQNIGLYFGKTDKGVYEMQETIRAAITILQKAFGDWAASIKIDRQASKYQFDHSYFINFNYTDTLEKRFHVDEKNDYHIHGACSDPETIIFGHSTHPEMPFPELMEQKLIRRVGGGKSKRLRELYLMEDALYETNKHVQDNIDDLCEFMALDGVHIEEITDIYVLGHSFGEPDYEYFKFLVKATQAGVDFNELSPIWMAKNSGMENLDEKGLFEWIQMNVMYATQHRKRVLHKDDISFPAYEKMEKRLFGKAGVYTDSEGAVHKNEEAVLKSREAVQKRFLLEQACRTREVLEDLCISKGVDQIPETCYSILGAANAIDGGHAVRKEDAKWHIAYFTDQDKKQIETVMSRTNCRDYELYCGIPECIERFRIRE